MAFTPQLLGKATGSNITTLTVNTSGAFAAGGRVYGVIAMSNLGFDDFTDSVGNSYVQAVGSQGSTISAWLVQCLNNIRLPNNSSINTISAAPWSGSLGVFGVSGLVSGVLHGVSAGQGVDNLPVVALHEVPANDWVLGVVGVKAPSSNTFTQAAGFTSPGNFNSQVTTEFSTYAGFQQSAGGHIIFAPTFATPAEWVALMIAIAP